MPPAPAKPGDGFLGWLGRQVGYVSKAVKTDVTTLPAPVTPVVIHREVTTTEMSLPGAADIVLRRTTIDEAILKSAGE